ncbi:MAG: response regulator [Anaerolineae bacterium]
MDDQERPSAALRPFDCSFDYAQGRAQGKLCSGDVLGSSKGQGSGHRILIADDDESTRRSLRLIFEKMGYETETAGTGREAIEKAQGSFFSLALLDIRLPDMEGTELLAPLKETNPDMAVILVTGYASLKTAVQALNAGASGYITKPLDVDEVLSKAKDVLEKQRLVMENRRLYQAAQQELAQRQRAEEALKEYSERLEEMVEQRTKELRDAQEQLVLAGRLAAIGQLGASVGHELRNPLGNIKNSIYYINMKLGDADEKIRKHLKIMEKEIATSNKIINDLLGFARDKKPTLQKTEINTVVQDALSRTTVPDAVAVITELGEDLPPLMADSDQIGQVFINLILNAAQAMSDGGRLEITTRAEDGFIVTEFKDTGCGIPEENLGRLFEPLFTTKAKGIGLGLAVSKQLVEAHEGTIEVESQVGKGTTFRVRLPISGG